MSTDVPGRQRFEAAYSGERAAPWDTGEPSPPFVAAADRILGRVLDAGCGTGANAVYLAGRGCQVVGFDFVEEAIRRARARAADRGVSVEFLVKDATTLAEWGERFNSAIDSGLFHVFDDEDRARYVDGLARVLKPGGRLFLICFSDEEPPGQGPRRVSRQELHAAFADGWEVESITPTQFAVTPAASELGFSEGGPKTWFATIRRSG